MALLSAWPRYSNSTRTFARSRCSHVGLVRDADRVGTVAFAVSGAITAGGVGMDALGCTVVGTVTAIGGGTFRDAIILSQRPFWVEVRPHTLKQ